MESPDGTHHSSAQYELARDSMADVRLCSSRGYLADLGDTTQSWVHTVDVSLPWSGFDCGTMEVLSVHTATYPVLILQERRDCGRSHHD